MTLNTIDRCFHFYLLYILNRRNKYFYIRDPSISSLFQHCREKFQSIGPSCNLYADENRLATTCGWRRSNRRRASRSCCDRVSFRSGRPASCSAVWAAIHHPPWNGTRIGRNCPSITIPWATPTASSRWRSLIASRRTAANIAAWLLTNTAKTRLVA